jgi:hypothetical protein
LAKLVKVTVLPLTPNENPPLNGAHTLMVVCTVSLFPQEFATINRTV